MFDLRLIISGAAAFLAGLSLAAVVWWPDLEPAEAGVWPAELLSPPCGEAQRPSEDAPVWTLKRAAGPDGAVTPSRTVELQAERLDDGRTLVWAAFTQSTSELDRIWLDWAYREDYDDNSQLRQCGPQPVTWAAATPAVFRDDAQGRPRWFRACGQVPPKDRIPGEGGLICTDWARP